MYENAGDARRPCI